MVKKLLLALSSLALSVSVSAQTNSEYTTEKYLDSIKRDPATLTRFLQEMPKGADLHTHQSGATMAENLLLYAQNEPFCFDPNGFTMSLNPSCPTENTVQYAIQHPEIYNAIIDAWSMRNFRPGLETGHDHAFATFGKFSLITRMHSGEILAEIANRAGKQNELYLEMMVTPDRNQSGSMGKMVGWDPDLAVMRTKLLAMGIKNIVKMMSQALIADEIKLNKLLACETENAAEGCHVKIRYLYQVYREQNPEQVFAQLLAAFEAASAEPRIVGINMVQPEDGPISMRDYNLHMKMVGFLHDLYPNVNITLHAGELVPGLVPNEGLRFHIRNAVEIAKAKRIGHGVDIQYEDNVEQLLEVMAKNHRMVEINLSSNAAILNVSGKQHPLSLYLQHQVPVALSTDDEGVFRTDITEQYVIAVRDHGLSYSTIKTLSRNSLSYSFLPGENLWRDKNYQQIQDDCAKDNASENTISPSCQTFLDSNEKANMQWQLEKKFNEFEKRFTQNKTG